MTCSEEMLLMLARKAQWYEHGGSGHSASEVRKQKMHRKWSWAVTLECLPHFFSRASPPKYFTSFQRRSPLGNRGLENINLYGTFYIQITPSLQGPEISTLCSLEFTVSSVEHCSFLLVSGVLCFTHCKWSHIHCP